MIKFRYDKSSDNTIIKHEEEMYFKINEIVFKYKERFLKHNVDLDIEIVYFNDYYSNGVKNRVPFGQGYHCCIGITVLKNNKHIERYDKYECEFEEISDSWIISDICRCWFHLDVWLRTDTTEIEEDIKGMLEDIENSDIIKKID